MNMSLVRTQDIMQIWPMIRNYMDEAAGYTNGRYEAEDILVEILTKEYQLWILYEGSAIKGALVTSFVEYPRKKYVIVMFGGGIDGWTWKQTAIDTLKKWAADNGQDGIEIHGRNGWLKVFKEDGAVPAWNVIEIGV